MKRKIFRLEVTFSIVATDDQSARNLLANALESVIAVPEIAVTDAVMKYDTREVKP